jgi:hypothetical protein
MYTLIDWESFHWVVWFRPHLFFLSLSPGSTESIGTMLCEKINYSLHLASPVSAFLSQLITSRSTASFATNMFFSKLLYFLGIISLLTISIQMANAYRYEDFLLDSMESPTEDDFDRYNIHDRNQETIDALNERLHLVRVLPIHLQRIQKRLASHRRPGLLRLK